MELVMMSGKEEDKAAVWFVKVLLICRVTVVACDINMDVPSI